METINSTYAHPRPYKLSVYEDLHARFRNFLAETKRKADQLEREEVELDLQRRKDQPSGNFTSPKDKGDRYAKKGMELKQKETDLKREYVDTLEAFIEEFQVSAVELQELQAATARKIVSQWFFSTTAEQQILEAKAMNFTAIYRDASPEVLETTVLVEINKAESTLSKGDKGFLYWMENYCPEDKLPKSFLEWREKLVSNYGDTAYRRINRLMLQYRNLNFAFSLGKSMASLDPSQADQGKFWEPTSVEEKYLEYLS